MGGQQMLYTRTTQEVDLSPRIAASEARRGNLKSITAPTRARAAARMVVAIRLPDLAV